MTTPNEPENPTAYLPPTENPSAFPIPAVFSPECGTMPGNEGMLLRDYFAAKATEEDIANYTPETIGDAKKFEETKGFKWSREWAKFQYANAMLKARAAK